MLRILRCLRMTFPLWHSLWRPVAHTEAEKNPGTRFLGKSLKGNRPGARSAPGEICDFDLVAKAEFLRKMTRRAKRAGKKITVFAPHKGDFLKGNEPPREARQGKSTML